MAINLRHDNDDMEEAHEINVTPFIDVMLVLLIIFMVAAPLATVDVAVDLPASTAQQQARPDTPIFMTIKADRTWWFGEEPVSTASLAAALDRASEGDKDRRVFLRADKTVDYDTLMQCMNALRAAGYLKIALVGIEQSAAP